MKSIVIVILFALYLFSNSVSAQKTKKTVIADTTWCMAYDTTVQVVVEKNASFLDGDLNTFNRHVAMNIRYPIEAMKNNYNGTSYIKFVVDWNGQVKNVTVFKSSGFKTLDNEAVRVVKKSPLWIPAKNGDVCVPQQYILPVKFLSLGIIN